MSKDDSVINKRTRNTEFSQVVSPNTTPNRRRRNSMPLPPNHGGMVLPMVRHYRPPQNHQGQEYWYHVTTPQNFQLIQQSGGLIPNNLQSRQGVGLDESTGRGLQRSWPEQLRRASRNLVQANQETQNFPQFAQMLTQTARHQLDLVAHQGTNQENLYMSSNLGTTQDYLANRAFMEDGAHIIRVPRSGTRGFVQDEQGKNDDFRALGMAISTRHMEYAELSPEHVQNFYDKPSREFNRSLSWNPVRSKKAQPVLFQWQSGSCTPEERKRHGGGDNDQGGQGGIGGGIPIKV